MKQLLMVVVLALVLAPAPPTGAYALLSLQTAPTPGYATECDVADPGPGGEVVVYVTVWYSPGAQGIQFSAPAPSNSGLTHLYDEPFSPFLTVGDSQSSAGVVFTECKVGSFPVMAMHFIRTSAGDPCVPFRPAAGGLVNVDCNFNATPLGRGDGVILNSDGACVRTLAPSNPSPPDAATDVPTLAQLGWKEAEWVCGEDLGVESPYLYFGTTPDPPAVGPIYFNPYPVGTLQSLTTYYWQIASFGHLGPVWSFTTTGANPVATSTWGRIKALYH